MANALKRLFLLGPRRAEDDRSAVEEPTVNVDVDGMPLEAATSSASSALQPAAIFRQVLFNPTEFTPAWLNPRRATAPGSESSADPTAGQTAVGASASTDEPKPKRARRPNAFASPAAARTKPKRTAKPKADPTAD